MREGGRPEPVPPNTTPRPALYDVQDRKPSAIFMLLQRPTHHVAAWLLNQVYLAFPNPDESWGYNVLYRFTGGEDGLQPRARLILDNSGTLYGTAPFGGDLDYCYRGGCGVVFELRPNGDGTWTENALRSFTEGRDGGVPVGGLILDQSGNLLGTTESGGNRNFCQTSGYSQGCGVVFKLTPGEKGTWQERVLHRFLNRPGAYPSGSLVSDPAGNFYGTTGGDGTTTFGSVFEITP